MSGKSWIDSFKRREEEKREKKRRKYSPRHHSFAAATPEPKTALCPPDLTDDLVTVSVPVYGTPVNLLERAVGSILNGSHRHVRVVMISDGDGREGWGDMSEELIGDPRLIGITSPENWGPYFNHDVVLRASRGPLFAVQDSDDVSHHKRLEQQLATLHDARAEAVHSPIYECDPRGRRRLSRCDYRPGEHWAHRADHFGVYSRATLMELGGYHAGFRIGYDTNITSFLNLLAKTTVTREALYTRHERSDSLTRNARTGYRSDERERSKKDLRTLWGAVHGAMRRSRRAAVETLRSAALGRAAQYGNVTLRDELIRTVRERLDAVSVEVPPLSEPHLRRLIAACHGEKRERLAVSQVYRFCEKTRPARITTLASPMSTVAAICQSRLGIPVRCLEPDSGQRAAVRRRLAAVGLGKIQVEQKFDPDPTPGLLIIGEQHPLATIGRLTPGTEVWLPEARGDQQLAELPGRRVPSECGMLRVIMGER